MNKKSLYSERWAKMGGGGDGIEAPWTKDTMFFMEGVTDASDDDGNSHQADEPSQVRMPLISVCVRALVVMIHVM